VHILDTATAEIETLRDWTLVERIAYIEHWTEFGRSQLRQR